MTRPQRLIVEDYLWRESLGYLGGALVYLVALLGGWWYPPLSLMGFGGGSMFLFLAIMRGGTGSAHNVLFPVTMLSFPINAAQLALCWRFLFFILPAAGAFAFLCLGTGIGAALGAPRVTVDRFLIIAVAQTLFLGWIFFILILPPRPPLPEETATQKAVRLFLRAAVLASTPVPLVCGFYLPLTAKDISGFHVLVAIVLAMGAVKGWRLAASGSTGTSFPRTTATPKITVLDTSLKQPWQAVGGIRYFIVHNNRATLFTALLMLGFYWLLMPPSEDPDDGVESFMTLPLVMTASSLLTAVEQLRLLRSMPISGRTLTSLMILSPLVHVAVMALAFGGFHSLRNGVSFPFEDMRMIICSMACGSVITPVVLRFGNNPQTFAFSLITTLLVVLTFHFRPEYPGYTSIYFPITSCMILAVSWLTSYHLLATVHPWRVRASKPASTGSSA